MDAPDADAMSRWCPRCRRLRPRSAFGYRDRARTRVQSYCRPCTAAYHRAYYAAHRTEHIAAVNERRRRRIRRNRAVVNAAKDRPCHDCGNSYPPAAMDLDHVRGTKVGDVSRLVYEASIGTVLEEIAKCDVVCATCHRLRTLHRRSQTTSDAPPPRGT